jgi:MFS family permease
MQAPAASKTRPAYAETFGPLLNNRGFRLFWLSSFAFFVGTGMQSLVMAWLAYDLTHSTFLLGVYTAANLAPQLLGPLGGVAAERFDRVRLLLGAKAACAGAGIGIAALSAVGALEYWHIVMAGFVLGVTQSTMQPARATAVMDLVPRKELSGAMALNNIAQMSNAAIGPFLGGQLLDRAGIQVTLACAAVAAAVAAAFLLRVHLAAAGGGAGESPLKKLLEGFRLVAKHRPLQLVLFVTWIANVFGWPAFATFMPVFAKDVLKVGPDGLGLMQTVFGAGALAGAAAIAALGDFQWKGRLYLLGTIGFGLLYGLFALSHWYLLSLALLLAGGIAGSAFGVMQQTLVLVLAPPEARGRMMGVMMLAIGAMPLSSFVLGAIAARAGAQATAATCGFLLVLATLVVYALSPTMRRMR